MEIRNIKNKLLDTFNIERFMTEEEIKEKLSALTRQRITQTLFAVVVAKDIMEKKSLDEDFVDGLAVFSPDIICVAMGVIL